MYADSRSCPLKTRRGFRTAPIEIVRNFSHDVASGLFCGAGRKPLRVIYRRNKPMAGGGKNIRRAVDILLIFCFNMRSSRTV